jgi:SNF2-related domain
LKIDEGAVDRSVCGVLDDAGVRRSFHPRIAARGYQYAHSGRVLDIRMEDDGHVLHAKVAGSRREPYLVSLAVRHTSNRRVTIFSSCTCPVERSCKHAAAVLFAAIDARQDRDLDVQPVRRDPEVERWLRALAPRTENSAPPRQLITYRLHVNTRRELQVEPAVAERLSDGSLHASRLLPIEQLARSTLQMANADDVVIGRLLADATSVNDRSVRGGLRTEALGVLLRTGRAYWHTSWMPLCLGECREGTIAWTLDDDGTQSPQVLQAGHALTFFLTHEPWYVDPASGETGPLELGIDSSAAVTILRAPPLRDADAAEAAAQLRRYDIALPRTTIDVRVCDDPPVVALRLKRAAELHGSWRRYGDRADRAPAVAQLAFRYGTHELLPGITPQEIRESAAGELIVRRRDRAAEDAALQRLAQAGLLRFGGWIAAEIGADAGTFAFPDTAQPQSWAEFLLAGVPALRDEGWEVTVANDFPVTVVTPDGPWDLDLTERTRGDGFEVDITVDVNGRPVPLVPLIVAALARSRTLLDGDGAVVIGDLGKGRHLALPVERLRRVIATLVELFDPRRPQGRIGLARAVALDDLDGVLRLRGSGVEQVRTAARALRVADAPPAPIPAGLRAQLRPYQHDGLTWLQRLREHGLGGVLADSMGLGKTLQTLAHVLAEKEAGRLDRPALIVAPTSVLPNWRAEAERFAPSLRVLVLHGARRADRHHEIEAADVVVTSYALLTRDADVLVGRSWHLAVLDEAQNIKNPAAKVAQTAYQLQARQRIALTGTPIENHLGELWSLFAYVDSAILGERAAFNRAFRTPIEKNDDASRRAALRARVAPFILRRTKERVARELPPKTEMVRTVELGSAQRDLYETIRAAMHERVRAAIAKHGLAKSQIVLLDALLKLRQVCCDPRLVKTQRAQTPAAGAKLAALIEMLEEQLDDGRRVLVFSQFTACWR